MQNAEVGLSGIIAYASSTLHTMAVARINKQTGLGIVGVCLDAHVVRALDLVVLHGGQVREGE